MLGYWYLDIICTLSENCSLSGTNTINILAYFLAKWRLLFIYLSIYLQHYRIQIQNAQN